MEMINRLTADALDSQTFVDKLKSGSRQTLEGSYQTPEVTNGLVQPERGPYETRTQRRARERAEAKASIRQKKPNPIRKFQCD